MMNTMTAEGYIKHQEIAKQNVKKVQKVKDFIDAHKPDLVINRGMGDSIQEFKKWAKTEFRDDYGAAFSFLWNLCFPRAIEIESRFNEIEAQLGTTKEANIKTLNGKIIR